MLHQSSCNTNSIQELFSSQTPQNNVCSQKPPLNPISNYFPFQMCFVTQKTMPGSNYIHFHFCCKTQFRVTECFGLKGILKLISSTPCHRQGHHPLHQVASSPVQPGLNTSRDGCPDFRWNRVNFFSVTATVMCFGFRITLITH